MIKLIMITNNSEIAKYAVNAGVGRIFVDLEKIGKKERQGHLDTVISNHSLHDIKLIRQCLPDTELIVRLNPIYKGTKEEIEKAIDAGANLLMLPMIKYTEQVSEFSKLVSGRVGIVPLIETPQAMVRLKDIVKVKGIKEVYFGLNDLHIGLGLDFMFETLSGGMVDHMAKICKDVELPFGFGGIARIGEGLLPGELVLAEHLRLGSSMVILSRTFNSNATSLRYLKEKVNLYEEIVKLRNMERKLRYRSKEEVKKDQLDAIYTVEMISKRKRGSFIVEEVI